MDERSEIAQGKYLYAFIAGAQALDFEISGIDDGKVYLIEQGGVCAVVSDVPNIKLRPERRRLAAHQGVLKRLMEQTTVLPVTFGVVADDPQAVENILITNRDVFFEQLERVFNKVEMGLRVTWDVPNIFDYFIQIHPTLRAARDRFFGGHREPSQEDKIELGRMFNRLLDEDREKYTDDVEEVLGQYCFEIKSNKCRVENEVMNLVCLVGRDDEARFEDGILKAANLFDNNFSFDYNGPWAPHNFVDINLDI